MKLEENPEEISSVTLLSPVFVVKNKQTDTQALLLKYLWYLTKSIEFSIFGLLVIFQNNFCFKMIFCTCSVTLIKQNKKGFFDVKLQPLL